MKLESKGSECDLGDPLENPSSAYPPEPLKSESEGGGCDSGDPLEGPSNASPPEPMSQSGGWM